MGARTYRRSMLDGPVGGVLAIAIATAVAMVVFGVVFYSGEVFALTVRVGRLLGIVPPPPPAPVGMPLERIAADLRGCAWRPVTIRPGMSMAKYRGAVAAYDDALLDACRALDLSTELSTPARRRGAGVGAAARRVRARARGDQPPGGLTPASRRV